ncbi:MULTISPECIES: phosphoserine phosphatase SerB [unclassified Haladaptatus]|uniref:phosphoserine phosphatase SerB n=1 Tax=unclassified Haladaptatus TaxID=2622732 RepID=UPI00209C5646|nr:MULTISPECIES: phosphoserine phosphatase SerB [unclassified Haladaptatus]MCO8242840.1 phosphoserine phosphatase SerB [Haladaptatus sp. AB643]MCO8252600.1 phosphoserine phosphatase SerB [Haladaptatus sp. AB618]
MKLVAFDFDGTLSDSEMTVLLGKQVGAADEMADITARAMNDEISYAKSLRDRVSLLEGLSLEKSADAFSEVTLRPGAADILDDLADKETHVAILTGGFERGVKVALDREGVSVDTIVANRVVDDGTKLTGETEGPLIEGTKDKALRSLAEELDVDMVNTIAIGDGANDLPMLEVAGLAVGFDPKPAVAPACDTIVTHMNELHDVLVDKNAI